MVHVENVRREAWINHEGEKVRQEFLRVLGSRRKQSVPLKTVLGGHRGTTFFRRTNKSVTAPVKDSGARGDADDSGLICEKFFVITEAGSQGRLPVVIVRPLQQDTKRPAVVFLHATGSRKEFFMANLEAYAARGYVAVAIDCRYHGERATSMDSYSKALISAWRTGEEMPFIFDTVWDLIKLVDYLSFRNDVDPTRIGLLGISLGGMHAWFAAVADPRIAVVVPIIGVQNFSWAVHNEQWHARVQSIPHAFEVAKKDLGKTSLDAETVIAVWKRIAPGLMDRFDADHTIPAIAPRPVLIINGDKDPRCPVRGLERTLMKAVEVYRIADVPNHFKFKAVEGVAHSYHESMGYDASLWLDKFLKPEKPML